MFVLSLFFLCHLHLLWKYFKLHFVYFKIIIKFALQNKRRVEIHFQNKKLAKLASDERKCVKELGSKRAKLFLRRLSELYIAETLEDVRHLPGHYHVLTENKKGMWACDLDQPYRLIFEPHDKPIPTTDSGNYIWIEIKSVEITEIVNYHKEH